MSKKLVVSVLVIALFAGFAIASDIVSIRHQTPTQCGPTRLVISPSTTDIIAVMNRMTDDATEYYCGSGSINDTMAVHYQPLAACDILSADIQFNDATGPGGVEAYIWLYSDDAIDAYPSGIAPDRGTSAVSPLGTCLIGPLSFTTQSLGDWEPLVTAEQIEGIGGIRLENAEAFMVGFVKTEELEGNWPNPLADDCTARGYCYSWFGGPWMVANGAEYDWGAYNATTIEFALQVTVDYYAGVPPIIGGLNQLPNTVNLNKDCDISVVVNDDNGWDGDHAYLNVAVNDGTPTEIEIFDEDEDGTFIGTFNLGNLGVAVGDQVSYWVYAVDEGGADNTGASANFTVIEFANPDAQVLVIDDGLNYPYIVQDYFDNHFDSYEWYDAGVNKGIDEFAVNAGWDLVMLLGWGAATMDTRTYDETNPFVAYLDAGGDMVFCDQDYFYANGEDAEPFFNPGDFAYDYFGIAFGLNDPYTGDGEYADSLFEGVDGCAITEMFVADPYAIFPQILYNDTFRANWTDDVSPTADATELFIGLDNAGTNAIMKGTDPATESVTMYFAFDFTWAGEGELGAEVPTDQMIALMNNILQFYNMEDVEEGDGLLPNEYVLTPNFPNPFNPSTSLSFVVPNSEITNVAVYNLQGREVANLFSGVPTPGQRYTVTFNAEDLASGVYFYRLSTPSFTQTRKMILLK